MGNNNYQICSSCVMDTTDPDITFDEFGVCSYCNSYKEKVVPMFNFSGEVSPELGKLIDQIKADGKGKPYDCIAGVSGGVDSTYAALLMKKYGIRALMVHVDNGWNSELAVKNIENIINRLGFDLYTKVLDWEEIRKLQIAYLKASVIDLEAISDHAIISMLYKMANKYNLKWILGGTNVATEATLPDKWRYADKGDAVNIVDINHQFGNKKLNTFPLMGLYELSYYLKIKQIKFTNFLDYFKYDKAKAKEAIINELDWKDYGGKHYESIITKFYQGYILYEKFGIDKRKAHLSTLIQSGQITRENALNELANPPLTSTEIDELKEYVTKKLGLTLNEFDNIMKLPVKSHYDYKTDHKMRYRLFKVNSYLNKLLGK